MSRGRWGASKLPPFKQCIMAICFYISSAQLTAHKRTAGPFSCLALLLCPAFAYAHGHQKSQDWPSFGCTEQNGHCCTPTGPFYVCTQVIKRDPNTRILVSAPSNWAADLLATRMIDKWGPCAQIMMRVNAYSRNKNDPDIKLRNCNNFVDSGA